MIDQSNRAGKKTLLLVDNGTTHKPEQGGKQVEKVRDYVGCQCRETQKSWTIYNLRELQTMLGAKCRRPQEYVGTKELVANLRGEFKPWWAPQKHVGLQCRQLQTVLEVGSLMQTITKVGRQCKAIVKPVRCLQITLGARLSSVAQGVRYLSYSFATRGIIQPGFWVVHNFFLSDCFNLH